jgi:FMNH2-dependent dimethyl sulfone monooxygenase
MKFGIWTPLPHTIKAEPRMEAAIATIQRRGEGAGADCGFDFAAEVLREAETLGFDRTLVAQRYIGPDLDAWILATALAMVTERMQMIVAVHPGIVSAQQTAKMAASLDRISGGRAAINLVNGWWQEEYDMFGNGAWLDQSDERYRRMEDFLAVAIKLWTEDSGDYEGRYYSIANGRMPSTPLSRPHPPLYTASLSEEGKRVAARYGDLWFANPRTRDLSRRDFAQIAREIGEEAAAVRAMAAEHGRTIEIGVSGHVICADTQEEAERLADELTEYGNKGMMNFIVSKSIGTGLVGTPEILAERLSLYESLGVSFTMLHFHPMQDGMRRFAGKVMPLLGQTAAAP